MNSEPTNWIDERLKTLLAQRRFWLSQYFIAEKGSDERATNATILMHINQNIQNLERVQNLKIDVSV